MPAQVLSKSAYMTGLQCPKALWLNYHRKDLRQEDGDNAQMAMGNEVGALARNLYPNGVLVNYAPESREAMAAKTKTIIAQGKHILYEASALSPDGAYAKADILHKTANGWHLIEVKSSTSVKDYHLTDLAFQRHAFESAGIPIERCFLVVINNQYERQGEIDIAALFVTHDVTEQVGKQEPVGASLQSLQSVVMQDKEPTIEIGAQCTSPFECGYKSHCWEGVPEYSTFNALTKDKAASLYQQTGSYRVEDIPASDMPKGQTKIIDINAYRSKEVYLDKPALAAFLRSLKYPLYFLDYETISHPIPLFDQIHPYQNVPFQFSLHIQDTPDGMLKHTQFLYGYQRDPREEFCEALIAKLGTEGSVIVYNQSFEEGCNRELAEAFPQYAKAIYAINARMVDLLKPFQKRWAYHPAQCGSASIKKVLPAFTDLGYDELEIGNGMEASNRYLHFMQHGLPEAEKDKLLTDLTAYCELDTYAMVKLVEVLGVLATPAP